MKMKGKRRRSECCVVFYWIKFKALKWKKIIQEHKRGKVYVVVMLLCLVSVHTSSLLTIATSLPNTIEFDQVMLPRYCILFF
jgi:hypothetical protein